MDFFNSPTDSYFPLQILSRTRKNEAYYCKGLNDSKARFTLNIVKNPRNIRELLQLDWELVAGYTEQFFIGEYLGIVFQSSEGIKLIDYLNTRKEGFFTAMEQLVKAVAVSKLPPQLLGQLLNIDQVLISGTAISFAYVLTFQTEELREEDLTPLTLGLIREICAALELNRLENLALSEFKQKLNQDYANLVELYWMVEAYAKSCRELSFMQIARLKLEARKNALQNQIQKLTPYLAGLIILALIAAGYFKAFSAGETAKSVFYDQIAGASLDENANVKVEELPVEGFK